ALKKAMPFPTSYGGDGLVLLKLMLQGEFARVHEPLLKYRLLFKKFSQQSSEVDPNFTPNMNRPPWTGILKDVLKTIQESHLDTELKDDLCGVVVKSISHQNFIWKENIVFEHFGINMFRVFEIIDIKFFEYFKVLFFAITRKALRRVLLFQRRFFNRFLVNKKSGGF
ncbi:hypothetical protein ACFLRA_03825, partial [Bdellovibrionota bacterium]